MGGIASGVERLMLRVRHLRDFGQLSRGRAAPSALPAYAALGYWRPPQRPLDARLELLVAQLSAQLSACRWCLDQARHRWLAAFLPQLDLSHLLGYERSAHFSERERAALALAEAVAGYSDRDASAAAEALQRARRHFAERELVQLIRTAAGSHFFNPATGALGRDALRAPEHEAAGGGGHGPWGSIARGIQVNGWS